MDHIHIIETNLKHIVIQVDSTEKKIKHYALGCLATIYFRFWNEKSLDLLGLVSHSMQAGKTFLIGYIADTPSVQHVEQA